MRSGYSSEDDIKIHGNLSSSNDESVRSERSIKKSQTVRRSSSKSPSPSRRHNKSDGDDTNSDASVTSRRSKRSTNKFTGTDFSKSKKHLKSMQQRKSSIAKARGLKLDPSQLTRQELLEKFASIGKLTLDSKDKSGEIFVEGKRLLEDQQNIIIEILKRFTEIHTVHLINCGLNDIAFERIMVGLKYLRHLKSFSLQQNLLTIVSLKLLIKSFAKSSRKLEVIDLRQNSLTFSDGQLLYNAFSAAKELSKVPITSIRLKDSKTLLHQKEIIMSNCHIMLPEIAILCQLLKASPHVTDIQLDRNDINSEALNKLMEVAVLSPNLSVLDLSYNPLVGNNGKDTSSIELLGGLVRNSTQLSELRLDGIDHLPKRLLDQINQSLAVNRSLKGNQSERFDNHVNLLLKKTLHPQKEKMLQFMTNYLANANYHVDGSNTTTTEGEIKYEIDREFVRHNRIPVIHVKVNDQNEILIETEQREKKISKYLL